MQCALFPCWSWYNFILDWKIWKIFISNIKIFLNDQSVATTKLSTVNCELKVKTKIRVWGVFCVISSLIALTKLKNSGQKWHLIITYCRVKVTIASRINHRQRWRSTHIVVFIHSLKYWHTVQVFARPSVDSRLSSIQSAARLVIKCY